MNQKKEFKQTEYYIPRTKEEKQLVKVFSGIRNEKEAAALLRDLMTIAEIEEFANRLQIAMLLKEGESYQKVAKRTKTSTTTVTRVAHWLWRGCGGYIKALR